MSHASSPELAHEAVKSRNASSAASSSTSPVTARASSTSTQPGPVTTQNKARTWDYIWRSGLAGGLAGCAGKTVVAPLDRVKILFQASNPQFAKYTGSWFGVATAMRDIYRQDGTRGLYRGHSATLLRIFPYAGIKFLAYEQFRALVIPDRSYETHFRRALSGSLAGVTSVFFTYPLEVMRVRLAFETKRDSRSSLASICRQIYHEQPVEKSATARLPSTSTLVSSSSSSATAAAAEAAETAVSQIAPRSGLINFYRGFLPTMLGMVPYAGVSFLTHDTVSDMLRHDSLVQYTTLTGTKASPSGKPSPLRSWAELTAGGVAGLISQTASYPLEVIRRRMQVGGAVGDGRRLRLAETASIIFRERGFPGFFVGLSIGFVKVIPMSAIAFLTYERVKLALGI